MAEIGVGIIGTGFMGECHALAFSAVAPVFQPRLRPRLQMVADVNAAAAERARERFGFARASSDWRELVADPSVELVSITAPNILHKEMALAAIAAGKHVYCEKPLALTAEDARELTLAAEAAGVRTMVGYNYLCSPGIRHSSRWPRSPLRSTTSPRANACSGARPAAGGARAPRIRGGRKCPRRSAPSSRKRPSPICSARLPSGRPWRRRTIGPRPARQPVPSPRLRLPCRPAVRRDVACPDRTLHRERL